MSDEVPAPEAAPVDPAVAAQQLQAATASLGQLNEQAIKDRIRAIDGERAQLNVLPRAAGARDNPAPPRAPRARKAASHPAHKPDGKARASA